jgi:hypothetical protein
MADYNPPRCNCPDAINSSPKNLFSSSQSKTFDRKWKVGFIGIKQRGYYCKHEMAVINYRGETEQAFPNGIPYEPKIDSNLITRPQTQQRFESDDFYV